MPEPIRILIADDHPIVREGLSAVLETQADFAIVGEAVNGPQAVALVSQLQPDVILLDLELPELDGVAALRAIRTTNPAARAIVFTAFDTDERILGAVQAGAQGYLLKGAPREELFEAIRVVYQGGSLLQPVVAARLLDQVRAEGHIQTTDENHHAARLKAQLSSLTERELEVLQLLALGRQNKEIAVALTISERTVKFHVSAILAKLQVGNRTEAVTRAAQLGLVEL